jgi:hypothetical protein
MNEYTTWAKATVSEPRPRSRSRKALDTASALAEVVLALWALCYSAYGLWTDSTYHMVVACWFLLLAWLPRKP